MNRTTHDDQAFLTRLTKIVESNLNDENFGVSELAKEVGISRSKLYLKIKSLTQKSASRFIREIRLNKAMEKLKQTSLTASEVAYQVGFGSPTYFNRCFHEYFGYPPGEAKKHVVPNSNPSEHSTLSIKTNKNFIKQHYRLITAVIVIIILSGSYFVYHIRNNTLSEEQPGINPEKSVIVLPFKNLSSEQNNQYFADGVYEDILTQLTKISGLKVLSRTSAEQFRESLLSSTEIAQKMDVNFILEGSLRRQGNNVRISVQLIEARQDRHLWSEYYDRQMEDIFSIQSDISKNIASKLQAILSPEDIKRMEKLLPKNAKAYDYYLMGRYLWDKRDSASLIKSIEYFGKAIEIDPEYSLAFAGLADSYYALAFTGNIDRQQGYDQAYEMAEKALKIDPELPEAYAVLGIVNYFGYWNWEAAGEFFNRAFEIDSNCMVVHLYYCSYLDIIGEEDKALKHANKANALEPYFYLPVTMKAVILRNEKKYIESNEAFRKGQELGQAFGLDEDILHNYLDLKDEAAVIQTLREIFSVRPYYNKYLNRISSVNESSGINGLLELYLDAINKEENESLFLQAALCARLGKQNEAMDYLEKACRKGMRDVPRIIRRPEYESLHSNPRFLALVDTMNLAPYFSKFSE